MDDLSSLLNSASAGERPAFESLVRSQTGRLFGIAGAITRDAALAEDVVQEVFLRIVEGRFPRLPSGKGEAYLARVAARAAVDGVRRRKSRRRSEETRAVMQSQPDETPLDRLLSEEVREQVAGAFGLLTAETRASLWLHIVEGNTIEETAAALGSNRSSVYRRIQSGRARLQEVLRGRGFAAPALVPWGNILPRLAPLQAPAALVERLLALGASPSPAAAPLVVSRLLRGGTLLTAKKISAASALALLLLLLGAGLLTSRFAPDSGRRVPSPSPETAAIQVHEPAGRKPAPLEPADSSLPLEPPAPSAEPVPSTVVSEETGPVRGMVVQRESGDPIAGAIVRAGGAETTTGDDGRFELSAPLSLSSVGVEASAEGFARGGTQANPGGPEVVVLLEPVLEIRGRVVDPDGNPIEGAVIDIGGTAHGGSMTFMPGSVEGLTRSGADGSFRLTPQMFGRPRLTAYKPGYGGTVALGVSPGASDLVIEIPKGATARGRVLSSDGSPAAGQKIHWRVQRPENVHGWRGESMSGLGGEFELLGLPAPGKHWLQATDPVTSSTGEGIVFEAEPGGEVGDLELPAAKSTPAPEVEKADSAERPADEDRKRVADRTVRFRGVVVGPGDAPVSGAHVRIHFKHGYVACGARDVTDLQGQFDCTLRERIGKEECAARIEVTHPSYASETEKLPPIAIGDEEEIDATPEPVRITVTAGFGIEGTAVDSSGAPIEGVQVLVHEEKNWADIRLLQVTGPDGRFVLRHRNARHAFRVVLFDPERAPWETSSPVPPIDGGTIDLGRVVLGRGGRVEGVLRRQDGKAGARHYVTLEGRELQPPALTDKEGRFVLEHVPAGAHKPLVFKADGSSHLWPPVPIELSTVEVEEGARLVIELRMQ